MPRGRKRKPTPTRLERLVIDGYNLLIGRFGTSLDVRLRQEQFHRLLLHHRQRRRHLRITVVYDGKDGIVDAPDPRLNPLRIVYARRPQTADEWIVTSVRDLCRRGETPGVIGVVTTDIKDIWLPLRELGVQFLSGDTFWRELEASQPSIDDADGANISVSSHEVDETAKFLGVHPEERITLSQGTSTGRKRPSKRTQPPTRREPAAEVTDSPKSETELPELFDIDGWEEEFNRIQPSQILPSRKKRGKAGKTPAPGTTSQKQEAKPPKKHGKNSSGKNLPKLTDLDAWEDLFSDGEEF